KGWSQPIITACSNPSNTTARRARTISQTGFWRRALGEELPAAPGSRIYVIEDVRDVTAEMLKGVSDKLNEFARYERLATNRKALIAACEGQPNRRCDVGAYYGGASYYLQQKLEIEDVRLVYAPALGIGNFGGETDNWMWPRHTGHFGFYRAYVAPDGSSRPYARQRALPAQELAAHRR
ncbi:S46 family peptidase, partial [Mesorhizobium sp. M0913]